MIKKILKEVRASGSTVTLDELSRKLQVEPSALAGMIDFLVQRGDLRLDEGTPSSVCNCAAGKKNAAGGYVGCSGGCHRPQCGGPAGCPFVVNLPRTYSLVVKPIKEDQKPG